MAVVKLFVENIHDLSKVSEELKMLGKLVSLCYLNVLMFYDSGTSHFHRGIKSEFIDVMGPIFCNTIRKV